MPYKDTFSNVRWEVQLLGLVIATAGLFIALVPFPIFDFRARDQLGWALAGIGFTISVGEFTIARDRADSRRNHQQLLRRNAKLEAELAQLRVQSAQLWPVADFRAAFLLGNRLWWTLAYHHSISDSEKDRLEYEESTSLCEESAEKLGVLSDFIRAVEGRVERTYENFFAREDIVRQAVHRIHGDTIEMAEASGWGLVVLANTLETGKEVSDANLKAAKNFVMRALLNPVTDERTRDQIGVIFDEILAVGLAQENERKITMIFLQSLGRYLENFGSDAPEVEDLKSEFRNVRIRDRASWNRIAELANSSNWQKRH